MTSPSSPAIETTRLLVRSPGAWIERRLPRLVSFVGHACQERGEPVVNPDPEIHPGDPDGALIYFRDAGGHIGIIIDLAELAPSTARVVIVGANAYRTFARDLVRAVLSEYGPLATIEPPEHAPPAVGPVRSPTPHLPTKQRVLRRWKATWKVVRDAWRKGASYEALASLLQETHPALACSTQTLTDIIAAGEAGLLD